MLTEKIIKPNDIESTLRQMWEELGKKNKIRASLFNLIVYNKFSQRTNYFRDIVLKLIEKYPCRVIFITADSSKEKNYLKTAVSIISPENPDNAIACDNIDIGVGGKDHRLVPFVVLPHILPDLPIYLLWAENPCEKNTIFPPFEDLATRLIFDSESCNDLVCFAKHMLNLHKTDQKLDCGDLNWARTQQWRDLFASIFRTNHRLSQLNNSKTITITYNSLASQYFCKEKIKSIYFQAWLASRLDWLYLSYKSNKEGSYHCYYEKEKKQIEIILVPNKKPTVATGVILSVKIVTHDNHTFYFYRDKKKDEKIHIHTLAPTFCEVPYYQIFSRALIGQSLINEIFYRGTSDHYLSTLKTLLQMKELESC